MLRQCQQRFFFFKHNFHTAVSLRNKNCVENLPENVKTKSNEIKKDFIPVERQSLTRGLTLNYFEKDFFIYPEYMETDEVELIKNYVKKIDTDFEKALVSFNKNDEFLSPNILQVLVKNNVFSTIVSKAFGGSEFNQKSLLMVNEVLAENDLSLYILFNQIHSAVNLISIFGSEEQKQKYLPKIANFQIKPTICIYDDSTEEGEITKVSGVKGQVLRLNGTKINAINANIADLFIVFAQNVNLNNETHCYIIERENLGVGGSITIQEQNKLQGLNSTHFSKINFTNVSVEDSYILGTVNDSTTSMLDEIQSNGKTFYGSAIVGCLKKLTNQLSKFANRRMEGNLRLADLHSVQSAVSKLTINLYVLESMIYYIAGLCDEDLFLLNDVENSIIQRYANKTLKEAIICIMDVAGIVSTNVDFPFDKTIRDLMTLLSLNEPDLQLIKKITLPTLETFIKKHGSMTNFMKKFTLTKMFQGDYKTHEKLKNPKMSHFIAEHVHPSLEPAARALELSMARVFTAIDHLLTDRGIYIKDDYIALKELATVLENNMGMTATIARASRSYSIGLKNAQDELEWTIYYCSMVSKQTENILMEIINHFGLITFNPKITNVGQSILQNNGYCIERPIERNW